MGRFTATTNWFPLWALALAVRLLAVLVLVAGPWTDEPAELRGWDAERFQQIADRAGDGWAEEAIEYPPGSVLVFDLLVGDDVVATNRTIVIVSALSELVCVWLIWRFLGDRPGKAFLLIGLPLLPMGLLRLDMVAAMLATAAAVSLLVLVRNRATAASGLPSAAFAVPSAAFAVLVCAGTMIKIWPVLLVAGALGLRRATAAVMAATATATTGLVWLLVVGAGLDPLDQILSLRGATGWHVESLPGALVALTGDDASRLELNAFRIGQLDDGVVIAGRLIAVATIAVLTATAWRRSELVPAPGSGPRGPDPRVAERLALVMLGSVAALVITAPLLSPQFLLWMTPWVAMLFVDGGDRRDGGERGLLPPQLAVVVALVTMSIVLTGIALTVFGPPNVTTPIAASLLTARNLCLVAVPVACLLGLRRSPDPN